MDNDREERFEEMELREPAGKVIEPWPGITPRTTRRQEQLDRLMDDPSSGGVQPPGDANVDERNRASAAEGLNLERHLEERTGAPPREGRPARGGDRPASHEG